MMFHYISGATGLHTKYLSQIPQIYSKRVECIVDCVDLKSFCSTITANFVLCWVFGKISFDIFPTDLLLQSEAYKFWHIYSRVLSAQARIKHFDSNKLNRTQPLTIPATHKTIQHFETFLTGEIASPSLYHAHT